MSHTLSASIPISRQPGLNIGRCCVTLRELLLWRDLPYLHLFPFLKLIILKNALIITIVLDLLPGRLALVRQVSDQKFGLGIIDHMHNTWSPYQSDHLPVQWSLWCIRNTTASSQMETNNGCFFCSFSSCYWQTVPSKWGGGRLFVASAKLFFTKTAITVERKVEI